MYIGQIVGNIKTKGINKKKFLKKLKLDKSLSQSGSQVTSSFLPPFSASLSSAAHFTKDQ